MQGRTRKAKKVSKIDKLLEIPQEISNHELKITVIGFKQMLIENYQSILEYQDYYVRINTNIGILNINGFHLNLKEMTSDDLLITGMIDGIDYENVTDEE